MELDDDSVARRRQSASRDEREGWAEPTGGPLTGGDAGEFRPGGRGIALDPDDPLVIESTVAVLGTHRAAALIAIDLRDDSDDGDRELELVVSDDRTLVTAADRALIGRLTPA